MIERLYSAVKRRRRGLAITSESGTGRRGPGAEDEVLVLFLLIKVRFLSPPYSNCPGSTCLTHLGTEGGSKLRCLMLTSMPSHHVASILSSLVAPLAVVNES